MPQAGLIAPGLFAQRLGVAEVIDSRLDLGGRPGAANCGAKALTVIGAMLAGGDSIDDCDLLRSAALPEVFDQVRAPSTIGTWLRSFRWHHVRQLDAASRELLARQWAAGAGPTDLSGSLTIDVDSTVVEVYGRGKQGAQFGYTKVRGYHPQLATLAETGEVLHARLRGGNAGTARGAASFIAETVARVRHAGACGQLTLRADAGFYSRAVLRRCRRLDVRFSVTVRQDPKVKAAIEAIPEDAWRPIPYWLSTPEVSGADIAETRYICFAGTPDAVDVRLVVRRVRPTPGSQLALFTSWDYHAFVTDRDGALAVVEAEHRRHAVVEQVIADLKSAGLAHLPSGRFAANAAWLLLSALAHNLLRGLATLAGHGLDHATSATLRRTLLAVPGRLVHSARRRHLRLPTHWPWASAFTELLTRLIGMPMRH